MLTAAIHASEPPASLLLPVVRADELAPRPAAARWLVRDLWLRAAVGIIGGQPKCGKTWLGLELAVSVAAAAPCLGCYAVDDPGPALVYLAEDAAADVRDRVDSICRRRNVAIEHLDLFVITVPALRLDTQSDRARLAATVAELRPRLLLLDPLVRLHRLDENSASEISGLLAFLRELQRRFDLAVVLVHHAGKRDRARPGQSLRGSSDLHSWTDSAAYLRREGEALTLQLEHRSAPSPPAVRLRLDAADLGSSSEESLPTGLRVVGGASTGNTAARPQPPLAGRILAALQHAPTPLGRDQLRAQLRIRNERLGQELQALENKGLIHRQGSTWTTAAATDENLAAQTVDREAH